MRELRGIWGSFGDVEVVEVVLPQGTGHNIPYPKPHHLPFNTNYPPKTSLNPQNPHQKPHQIPTNIPIPPKNPTSIKPYN